MALINITPLSARDPRLVALCTEFECAVAEMVARHAPEDADVREVSTDELVRPSPPCRS